RRAKGPGGATALFREEKLDALAGLVPALREIAPGLPSSRLLPGRYTTVRQAVGTKPANRALKIFVQQFIAEAKAGGLVAELVQRHGVTGKLQVAAAA